MNWGNVAVCGACFAIGFGLAYYRGEEAIRQVQLDAAVVRANDGRKSYEKIVAAQDALDASRRDVVRLERLRVDDQRRARRESAGACRVEREAVARCEGLLRESAELLAEGGNLLQRNADLHDALAKAVKK